MPTDRTFPAGHPAGGDLCGWYIREGRRGWRCNAPALHDHEHELRAGGQVTARSAGYHLPPAASSSPPLYRPR